jgi:uncharacterized membrane protein YbaN (DUF454 family)
MNMIRSFNFTKPRYRHNLCRVMKRPLVATSQCLGGELIMRDQYKEKHVGPLARGLYRLGASLFLILGIVGMVLPVMPTTIFLILAVICLLRAGDHRAQSLLDHPRYGAPIRLFLDHGAITRRGKALALGGISFGMAFLVPVVLALPWLGVSAMVALITAACFIVTRPEPLAVPVQRDRCD